nr:hypothetical protein HK105_006388 [Polyrhizophydium stewartii]
MPHRLADNLDDWRHPETRQVLSAELARTRTLAEELAPLAARLREEMRSTIPSSLPPVSSAIVDDYEYVTDHEHGATVMRRRRLGGQFETILDSRWLGAGARGAVIGKALVSDDHGALAYVQMRPQDEQGTLVVKRLGGSGLADRFAAMAARLPRVRNVFNFVWSSDSRHILFTRLDSTLRSRDVLRVDTHDAALAETLLFREHDPRFFVDVTRSKDKSCILINSNATDTSEIRIVAADAAEPNLLVQREQGIQCFADILADSVFTLHTKVGGEFVLSRQPYNQSSHTQLDLAAGQIVAAPGPHECIENVELTSTTAVLTMRTGGTQFIRCDPASRSIRFTYSTPFVSEAACELDLASNKLSVLSRARPLAPTSKWTARSMRVPSSDGSCEIPVTLLHARDLPADRAHPCVVLGYGAYASFGLRELIPDPALCRGGGELGVQWHRMGRGENKTKSFADLADVVDTLVRDGIADASRIGGVGTSAGEMFKALVLRVPFLDPLAAMMHTDSPLASGEVLEWGDPRTDPSALERIAAFSPCSNIPTGSRFPRASVLATAGVDDQRVPPWHALRFVVRMCKASPSPPDCRAFFQLYSGRGHLYGSGDKTDELALECAFLLRELGVED